MERKVDIKIMAFIRRGVHKVRLVDDRLVLIMFELNTNPNDLLIYIYIYMYVWSIGSVCT